jgi:hypothetical protein
MITAYLWGIARASCLFLTSCRYRKRNLAEHAVSILSNMLRASAMLPGVSSCRRRQSGVKASAEDRDVLLSRHPASFPPLRCCAASVGELCSARLLLAERHGVVRVRGRRHAGTRREVAAAYTAAGCEICCRRGALGAERWPPPAQGPHDRAAIEAAGALPWRAISFLVTTQGQHRGSQHEHTQPYEYTYVLTT